MVPGLKEKYRSRIIPKLMKEFNYKTPMQVPKLEKIILNMGVGDSRDNPKALDSAVEELTMITGQRAVKTRARKSIAQFKIRAGMEIGCRVTLRGDRMYEFFNCLVNIALPRVRDFRGVNPDSLDGHGNYNLGIREQVIFPEIDYDKVEKIRGLDICIVTSANSDEEARSFLREMGMPFRR